MDLSDIEALLPPGELSALMGHRPKVKLPATPRPALGDRSIRVIRSLAALGSQGRLGGSGYLSILPMDHAMAYGAGSAFVPNPRYFDPAASAELAIEAGCSGLVTSFGMIGSISRRYAHRIPMILKFNHDDFLRTPRRPEQTVFARVRDAWNMGCLGVAATVYFGSSDSRRQLVEVAEMFSHAHAAGMFTILFCYVVDEALAGFETAADLTGQANHLGVTIEADIIKQKVPTITDGFLQITNRGAAYGRFDSRMYSRLMSDHPIDMTRYQLMNCFAGSVPLINSGGPSGKSDLVDAVKGAVVNKRAGGSGLLAGRKAFQRPLKGGIRLLNAIQDVYLCPEIVP